MKSLFDLYSEHQGKVSDKWSIYLAEYDRLFSSYRDRPVRMFEIGIQNGGSLEIWSKYFPGAEALVGCDINPDCAKLTFEDPRINVVVGDANTDATETEILTRSPNFDLIIDDGSHTSGDIVKSFARYFRHLRQGGIFVAEDLHCSYWSNFEGGLYFPYSSISFFKRLADIVNHEHWGIEKERKFILQGFAKQFETDFDESDLAEIHSIEFFNSVCVVHKRSPQYNVLGERFIAGENELVVSGHHGFSGSSLSTQSQTGNPWSEMVVAPEENWESLSKELSERDVQLARLAQEVDALRNSTSWRLTKPVRFVGHQIARGGHLVKIAPAAFQMAGGSRATLKKAFSLYRREGLSGIKRGIRLVQASGEIKPAVGSDAFDRNDYAEWVRRYDTIDEAKRARLRALCGGLASQPKISVVMPTYNPRPEWLIEAIESVRGQFYPNWELCIADDASPDPAIRPILERYAREDERIKVVFREQNGHISAASNSALELATGEWIALLDHDDLLPEHALALIAQAINRHPDAGLIYSDEDKIDEQGNRSTPYFKCEFNIDLLRSQNMISHLGTYRHDLIETIGGFRVGFEGSQDYDLALRVVEKLKTEQIVHIPHILYHWRVHADSTALHAGTKTYAQHSGLKALREHLLRLSIDSSVELTPFLQYRIRYSIPVPQPKVSLIIPTRNGLHLIRQCIESVLAKTTYRNYEILVIDNGSDDPEALNYFKSFDGNTKIRVIRDDSPFNYSALNNRAVVQADGEFVGLLNNDVEVITPGWLDEMLGLAIRPNTGAVGACLWYPNDTLQHGGVTVGVNGVAAHSHRNLPRGAAGYFGRAALTQGVSAVTAACLVIKKSIFLEVGGLNEADLQIAFNDVDFCLRVREAGYQNVWTPFAELYHHESATRGFEDTPEKKARFAKEVAYMKRNWGESLLNDPAYSPNLTLHHEDFSLAWPPRTSDFGKS
jgi:glycosyltransferase involved in cell wall biosynthesis